MEITRIKEKKSLHTFKDSTVAELVVLFISHIFIFILGAKIQKKEAYP